MLILSILNNRFLPSVFSNPDDNLKSAILSSPDKTYRIAIRFGTREKFETRNYIFSFGEIVFQREIIDDISSKFAFSKNQESSEK